MSSKPTAIALALVAGAAVASLGLQGCSSAGKALGMTKVVPDEFRVVTKAPLVVPPDYALRPPLPGEPRPQELQPESAARAALLGQSQGANRSDGEKLLAQKAGADNADPLVRFVVDDEFGDLAHKEPSFADRVMFWKKPDANKGAATTAAQAGADTPAPVDAAAEAQRLKNLTGDQPIQIDRDAPKGGGIKLPGL